MRKTEPTPSINRINAILPERLGHYVAATVHHGGLYENASEYIRDLIRKDMDSQQAAAQHDINALLRQSIAQNEYTPLTQQHMQRLRDEINGDEINAS